MCGGVRRHVTQSHLERAQRAMHDARSTTYATFAQQCDRNVERLLRKYPTMPREVAERIVQDAADDLLARAVHH